MESASYQTIKKYIDDQMNDEQLTALYDQWIDTYEKDHANVKYNGVDIATKQFAEYAAKNGLPKTIKILDVAAGTGLVARMLREDYGFSNIHALDASSEMLSKAKELNLYESYTVAWIGGKEPLPIPDGTYDAALVVGAVCPNHIPIEGFSDIARVVKPGGVILNAMRLEYTLPGSALSGYDMFVKKLQDEGIWECMATIQPEETWILNYKALVSIFRKL